MSYYDRRFLDPSFVFWSLNLHQRRQASGAVLTATRQSGEEPVTVQELREIQDILRQQESDSHRRKTRDRVLTRRIISIMSRLSPYFTSVKGSMPYLQQARKDLFSMLKHTSALPVKEPTWFATLSSAEVYWPEIFQAIDPSLSLEDIQNMPLGKRHALIRANPHIVGTIFYERFLALEKFLFHGESKPLGEIKDWFFRFEWQLRGAVHLHMLLFSSLGADAAQLVESEEGQKALCAMIDSVISTLFPETTPTTTEESNTSNGASSEQLTEELADGETCSEDAEASRLQHPSSKCAPDAKLSDPESQQDLQDLVAALQMHDCRKHMRPGEQCRFEFPKATVEETYITTKVKRSKTVMEVVTKRNDPWINNYNSPILRAWRGNIDCQFCAFAKYVSYYVSKTEPEGTLCGKILKSLHRLPRDALPEALLRTAINTAIGARQISHQEAVWILSGKSYCVLSRSISLLTVLPESERNVALQHRKNLENAPGSSTNIAAVGPTSQAGKIILYANRPIALDDMCWSEFEQKYEYSKSKDG